MLAELTQACEALGDVLTTVEPALLSGLDCAHVVEMLARTEKRCAAVRAVAAARAAQCGAHKDRGFVDATGWLGHVAGVAAPDARAALAVGDGLGDCPQTRQALLSGEVSLAQAAEITKTEAASRAAKRICWTWQRAPVWPGCAMRPAGSDSTPKTPTNATGANTPPGTCGAGATSSA
jgi:hypothetical protein